MLKVEREHDKIVLYLSLDFIIFKKTVSNNLCQLPYESQNDSLIINYLLHQIFSDYVWE